MKDQEIITSAKLAISEALSMIDFAVYLIRDAENDLARVCGEAKAKAGRKAAASENAGEVRDEYRPSTERGL